MSENLYEILEIPENSSLEEIKKAYRLQAIKYHPDKNNDPKAGSIFDKITKAYDILSDEKKRESYNAQIKKDKEIATKTSSLRQNIGNDLRFSINVTTEDIIKNRKKIVQIKRKGQCKFCEGTGSKNKKIKSCNFCAGTGLQGLPLLLGKKKNCHYCNGLGHLPIDKNCESCKGLGLIQETIRHEITLTPLLREISIPGMGDYPIGSGDPGDLIIELIVEPHPDYKINGLNISGLIGISPAQAILGDTIVLNVFDKRTFITIPPGTQHNDLVEQEKGGITFDGCTGFFKATIKIIIPEILTEEEASLYKQLLSIEKGLTTWPKTLKF